MQAKISLILNSVKSSVKLILHPQNPKIANAMENISDAAIYGTMNVSTIGVSAAVDLAESKLHFGKSVADSIKEIFAACFGGVAQRLDNAIGNEHLMIENIPTAPDAPSSSAQEVVLVGSSAAATEELAVAG